MLRTIIIIFVLALAYELFSLSLGGSKEAPPAQATISKEQFGPKWPLTVDAGTVKCLPLGNGAVVFEAGGKTYAVNGTAQGFSTKYGFSSIDTIWRQDPEFLKMAKEIAASEKKPVNEVIKKMGTPPKVNIDPVIKAGLKLCH